MHTRTLILLLILLTVATTSRAQTPAAEPASPTFDQLVSRLGDAKFNQRRDATTQLILRDDVTDEQLSQAMRNTHDPEAYNRLIRIAMHHFFEQMSRRLSNNPSAANAAKDFAALGVGLPPDNPNARKKMIVQPHQQSDLHNPAMLITQVYPGFPAYAYLQPGDLITAIDDKPFDDNLTRDEFARRIKMFKPGQTIDVEIIRNDQKLHFNIQLAHMRRLAAVSGMLGPFVQTPELFSPWREHLKQLAGASTPAGMIRVQPHVDESKP